MDLRFLACATVVGTLGCASGGQGGAPSPGGDEITIVVRNDYNLAVMAFAVWEGSRIRLGDVSAGRTRTFTTVRRGDRIAVGLQVSGAPGTTTAGPTRFSGGTAGDPDPSAQYVRSEPIDIDIGDGIEWNLASTGVLLYRRLSADSGSAAPVGGSR